MSFYLLQVIKGESSREGQEVCNGRKCCCECYIDELTDEVPLDTELFKGLVFLVTDHKQEQSSGTN